MRSIRSGAGRREAEKALDGRSRVPDRIEVLARQLLEQANELRDTSLASPHEDPPTLRRGADAHGSRVAFLGLAGHEAFALERLHEAGHRRRRDLLGASEPADRRRAPENEHGESRETRRGQTARNVHPPNAPQEMDGSRMQGVGNLADVERLT